MGPTRAGVFFPFPGGQSPVAQIAEYRKANQQNRLLNSGSDITTAAGSSFFVTFDRAMPNTRLLAELMESICTSLVQVPVGDSSDKARQIILKFLERINNIVVSLQKFEVPKTAVTKSLAEKVKKHVVNSPHIPEYLQETIDKLFVFFQWCQSFDYYMFGGIDQRFCRNLAKFLATIPGSEPLEIMAGAGWLQKGLKAEGMEIQSTDSFRINESDFYIERWLAMDLLRTTGMKEHVNDFAVIHGATVEKMDAIAAVKSSHSRVVIMCWPETGPVDPIYEVLEHCHKNQKLIIHISHESENLKSIVQCAGHPNEMNSFIPVADAPSYDTHQEQASIGFWKEVPEWFKTWKHQQEILSMPDFSIHHFNL